MQQERHFLENEQGVPAISYVHGERDGRPWAHKVEIIGPRPAETVAAKMRGWYVTVSEDFGAELTARGARLIRHAHVISCDLGAAAAWPPATAPEGFRFTPCDRAPEEVLPAWRNAFPPGHPDHSPRTDEEVLREELAPLLRGELIGPLLPCSSLAVDLTDRVVAGVVVNDWDGLSWVANAFRHPAGTPRGLGLTLLRHVIQKAAADGLESLTAVVSQANPARHIWPRIGFRTTETSMTVLL
ncbi:GNAT family N-acetyltransferase [Nonomuraea sp. NPDC001699]